MSFHGETTCQVEGCGLRLIADYKRTWYHDARDLAASGFAWDGIDWNKREPHEPIPDPAYIALLEEQDRRVLEIIRSQGRDQDLAAGSGDHDPGLPRRARAEP